MKYTITIPSWNSGLNELLNAQTKKWDPRLKKMRVFNPEKTKNESNIRKCVKAQGLANIKLKCPIRIDYMIYAKDQKHDRMNLGSCLDKCFCDALQTMNILSRDGWKDIAKITFDYDVDREHPRAEITITEI